MYKGVKELTEEQKDELRCKTYNDYLNDDIYFYNMPLKLTKEEIEMVENDYITDEILEKLYGDITFTDDDFWCSTDKN